MKKTMILLVGMLISLQGISATVQEEMQAAASAYQQGDKQGAFLHLQNAALAGDASAQYNLSIAYGNGDGTMVNPQQALSWLQQSANQGYLAAQYDLALYYLSQQDMINAAPWMKKAADAGSAPAQFNYAMMLMRGDGVAADKRQGERYLQQSAAQGFPPATDALAAGH